MTSLLKSIFKFILCDILQSDGDRPPPPKFSDLILAMGELFDAITELVIKKATY